MSFIVLWLELENEVWEFVRILNLLTCMLVCQCFVLVQSVTVNSSLVQSILRCVSSVFPLCLSGTFGRMVDCVLRHILIRRKWKFWKIIY